MCMYRRWIFDVKCAWNHSPFVGVIAVIHDAKKMVIEANTCIHAPCNNYSYLYWQSRLVMNWQYGCEPVQCEILHLERRQASLMIGHVPLDSLDCIDKFTCAKLCCFGCGSLGYPQIMAPLEGRDTSLSLGLSITSALSLSLYLTLCLSHSLRHKLLSNCHSLSVVVFKARKSSKNKLLGVSMETESWKKKDGARKWRFQLLEFYHHLNILS